MNLILSAALVVMILSIFYVLIRWGRVPCHGPTPVGFFSFMAILFTSGLDMGLVILPLTEFPTYAKSSDYSFTNPLAVEFGFWGFYIWSFYFITSFYFVAIEPKVKIFEKPLVKLINNIVIIGTCAFTAYLFLVNIDWYMPELATHWNYLLVAVIILVSVYSSTDIKYVKILSQSSTYLFFILIFIMWWFLGEPASTFATSLQPLTGYFTHLHKFILPFNDYHAFYLFWWFSWSIMIGQFVSRFVGGMKTYQLFLALLIVPSIPLAIWFTVLYRYHFLGVEISALLKMAMVTVGIIFVINSVDSLVRLYSDNLNLTVQRLGRIKYILFHSIAMALLVVLFQFTPLEIHWIGLIVIGLFATTLVLLIRSKDFNWKL